MFFNTINQTGQKLKASKIKAERQETKVLALFHILGGPLTPAQVYDMMITWGLISDKTPLTSIRRAINVLTKEGKLEKTYNKKLGNFGVPNHTWRLARPRQGELFDAQTNTDYGEGP